MVTTVSNGDRNENTAEREKKKNIENIDVFVFGRLACRTVSKTICLHDHSP